MALRDSSVEPASTPDVVAVRDVATDAPRDAALDPSRLQAFCRDQADANEHVYRRATRHASCPLETSLRVHGAMARCAMTPGGAWAIELRELHVVETDAGTPSCVGTWQLVFSYGDGTETRIAPGEEAYPWLQDLASASVPGALIASDLDGDGAPEALVRVHRADTTASDSNWFVWTTHGGNVVSFSPVADIAIIDVEDVDHDGRLDLITSGPYVARIDDTPEGEITGPALLAHTIGDGTFAFDDALARTFARRRCPRHARDVVVSRDTPDGGPVYDAAASAGDIDLEATARRVVCARIAGVDVHDVLEQLGVACTNYVSRGRDAGAAILPGTCPAFLRAWASTTPPVTLASPR